MARTDFVAALEVPQLVGDANALLLRHWALPRSNATSSPPAPRASAPPLEHSPTAADLMRLAFVRKQLRLVYYAEGWRRCGVWSCLCGKAFAGHPAADDAVRWRL